MPLLDHFHPPLSLARPWDGLHSAWASAISQRLNEDLLPPEYFSLPLVTVGVRIEADVGTFAAGRSENGGVATQTYAPPKPALTAALEGIHPDSFEVQVLRETGGTKLRAVIELVSPANKDRPGHRRAFAVKCASYLLQGVGVVIVDIVTERLANLHNDLAEVLNLSTALSWSAETDLYAVAYRPAASEQGERLEVWPASLAIGAELPTLPLCLESDLCVPLNLEQTYTAMCASVRLRV